MNTIGILCEMMGWSYMEVCSKSRKASVVSKRKCLSVAARDVGYSYNEIGKMISRKHSDVYHLVNGKNATKEEDDNIKKLLDLCNAYGLKADTGTVILGG